VFYSKEKNIYFWRTRSGGEVDFIVYGESRFCAIEVKNANKVHRSDLKSLHAFNKDYPSSEMILLYRGSEKLLVDGVYCLPCESFLSALKPDSWPEYRPCLSGKNQHVGF